MKKTVNLSHVRTINQRAILDAIFQKGDTSKAQLARMLNMSKPSMADNVAALLKRSAKELVPAEAAENRHFYVSAIILNTLL